MCVLGVALLAAAGCGDDSPDGSTTSTTAPEPTTGSRVVKVVNGDTGAELADATVAPVVAPSTEPGAVIAHQAGGFPLPADATGVYVRREPFGERYLTITATTPSTVKVPLFDPALQATQYGDNASRTRFNPRISLPTPAALTKIELHSGRALLEFPPVVWQGIAVFGTNRGRIYAYNVAAARPGQRQKPMWSEQHTENGGLMAASPAIYPNGRGATVIVAGMDGLVNSYNLRTAGRRTAWKRPFSTGGSAIETSPLIVGSSVFVGDHNGSLYKLNADTGVKQCGYGAAGAIKGSAARYGENIIFADYAGYVYSIRARDCALNWQKNVGRKFYGGPGVSGSTIVIGDVGGAVYGVNADTGNTIWRQSTGDMVYSSPAIARGVAYIGSYDHYLRALRVSDGKELWRYSVGGRISGSASVIGTTVYVSRLARPGEQDATFGIDTRNQKVVWQSSDGRYSPAVAAGRTLYIVGRTTLYAYRAQ